MGHCDSLVIRSVKYYVNLSGFCLKVTYICKFSSKAISALQVWLGMARLRSSHPTVCVCLSLSPLKQCFSKGNPQSVNQLTNCLLLVHSVTRHLYQNVNQSHHWAHCLFQFIFKNIVRVSQRRKQYIYFHSDTEIAGKKADVEARIKFSYFIWE